MIIPSLELSIIPLEKGHNLSPFSSSNDDLNDFLHNDALKSQEDLIGRYLLLAAVGKVHHLSLEVGCRYITVDSKREAVGFYERNGFKIIKKYENRNFPPMYLNMYPIIRRIEQKR